MHASHMHSRLWPTPIRVGPRRSNCTAGCDADPQAAARRLSASASCIPCWCSARRGIISTRGLMVQALLARARANLPAQPSACSAALLQRLRDIINKGLTNEELLRGVKTAWDKGWRQIKL